MIFWGAPQNPQLDTRISPLAAFIYLPEKILKDLNIYDTALDNQLHRLV